MTGADRETHDGPRRTRAASSPLGSYMDAATAAPMHPAAREALLSALEDGWADPTRLYGAGRRARLLLDGAREAVADVLGARPDEVHFPSSGPLASTLAVLGAVGGRARAGGRVLHSAVEHSAVLQAAATAEPVPVRVDRYGRVDLTEYASALDRGAALACLQSANGEVGTVQPVEELSRMCRNRGVPLHVDATASVGRAPVPDGWQLLSADAAPWGGPPGVGVLVVRTGTRFRSPLPGQAGVPSAGLPQVLAAAVALRAAVDEMDELDARLRPLVDRLRVEVPARVRDVEVVGDPRHRLPHVLTFSCLYVHGESLLRELDRFGFAVSSGSACTSDTLEPSHVLAAMGALTSGNVRVSLHGGTTEADVDRLLEVLPGVVRDLRRQAGADDV